MARRDRLWLFDNLDRIGGVPVEAVGAPRVTASPFGSALAFDGAQDGVILPEHPLAGAWTFTFEVLFRPDGGAFEQRWFHLESPVTPDDAPGSAKTRILFEIRVVGDRWYLDAFASGSDYRQALAMPTRTFPVGVWHHVAQTFDGRVYRAFVNGVLDAQAPLAFEAQGPGRTSVGMRLNGVNHFHGAVRAAHFGFTAKPPHHFRLLRPWMEQAARD